jgi:N6-adenosine-specific RNA methylase IME4
MKYYGIRYVTCGVWVKRTKHGKIAFGTGYRLRGSHEPFLIGTIGRPDSSKSIRSVLEGPVRENSRKPDEAYAVAEKMMPHAHRRADVFSRQKRPGWENWGDQAEHFAA